MNATIEIASPSKVYHKMGESLVSATTIWGIGLIAGILSMAFQTPSGMTFGFSNIGIFIYMVVGSFCVSWLANYNARSRRVSTIWNIFVILYMVSSTVVLFEPQPKTMPLQPKPFAMEPPVIIPLSNWSEKDTNGKAYRMIQFNGKTCIQGNFGATDGCNPTDKGATIPYNPVAADR